MAMDHMKALIEAVEATEVVIITEIPMLEAVAEMQSVIVWVDIPRQVALTMTVIPEMLT